MELESMIVDVADSLLLVSHFNGGINSKSRVRHA